MPLCTLDDVKHYLSLQDTDTQQDVIIVDLIPAAQNFIEEYCGRTFEAGEVIEYFTDRSDRFLLKNIPVDKTKTIEVYDSWDRTYVAGDLIPSTDYFVDGDAGIVMTDYEIGGMPGSVKVKYTGGYSTAAGYPAALRQACVELVARKVKEGPSGALGVPTRSVPEGGTVVFQIDALLPQTKIALDLFRA